MRHLQSDPVLPDQLAPDGWPGEPLRAAYAGYRVELLRLIARPDTVTRR